MKIAKGNSRMEKIWKNKELSWEKFTKIVKNTVRTNETMDNYRKLPKIDRDNIKDVAFNVIMSLIISCK